MREDELVEKFDFEFCKLFELPLNLEMFDFWPNELEVVCFFDELRRKESNLPASDVADSMVDSRQAVSRSLAENFIAWPFVAKCLGEQESFS